LKTVNSIRIEAVGTPPTDADVQGLADLLVDTVTSGSAVSFLPPLSRGEAEQWWRNALSSRPARAIVLVARSGASIAGTVQVQPAWAPNQPHRGEIVKLMVGSPHRGSGIGARLMDAIERASREAGYRLLTLDTKRGDGAERLYRKSGWIEAGVIPRYALNPDGTFHDTVIFYKEFG